MQIKNPYIILFIFFLILQGCNFGVPDDEFFLNVDNEFEIDIREELQGSNRSLAFKITGLKEVNCEETKLDLYLNSNPSALHIGIMDLIFPNSCGSTGSYPEGIAVFDVTPNNYGLEVNIQDIVNHQGNLIVSPEYYKMDLSNAKGLVAKNNLLYRIPDNFVWGYYKSGDEQKKIRIEQFLAENDLKSEPLLDLEAGFYSYFYIDSEGNIIIQEIPETIKTKSFGYEGVPLKAFQLIVEDFKEANPDLELHFYGSNGSTF